MAIPRLLRVSAYLEVYNPNLLENSGKDSVLKARINDIYDNADIAIHDLLVEVS